MFRRNDVKTPQEQGQNPHGDSSRGNGDRNRRFTVTFSRHRNREQPAETLAEGSKSAERRPDEMTSALFSEESSFRPRRQAFPAESSAIGRMSAARRSEESFISDLESRLPLPTTTPRDGLPPFRPRAVAFTDHHDSSDLPPIEHKSSRQSDESSSQLETPIDPSQLYKPGLNLTSKTFPAWGNKTTPKEDLATSTNQDLNNLEAGLEKGVERSTDLRARHRAKKQIEDIHEQKRENKREYFKGGLRKTYKNLIESMITVVTEDVKTTKEPKVQSKIFKSDEAARVVAEKRDKDKEKCTTHNRYAKLNSNSLFRSGIEQSLSRQPEFYQIERIILKQPKNKTQEVRSKLQEIRKRFDTDKTHLRAHGIVDIETGTIKLNGSDEVIHLHDIKSIIANTTDNTAGGPRISIQDASSHDLHASLPPSPTQAEASLFPRRRPPLRVSTAGLTLSPEDALHRDSDSATSPGKVSRSHKRRDSDAVSFHSELSTHGSSDKSWTIKLSDNKSVTVKNENTQSLLRTQHLINFQTGRIELGNGTIIDFKDIDWEKNKKDEPTRLHLKQESPLYKDGSTIDLKEASKSLDAAALVNRQKYEHALRQYSLTQMALLEKVAYAGSSSLSDMHALLAGIRTNESALIKVQEDIFKLKRAEDSVTAFDFKEEVRRIGNDATRGLLHIRQRALNKASQAYAWALKSSAYEDIRKEQGRFGKFGETDTVKTIKGLHEGPNKGIELQNDRDLPKYDRLKAEEPEFVAQKTRLETQRDDLAAQLEILNRRAKPLDTQENALRDEDLHLYQKDVPLNKREIELNKEAAPHKTKQAELRSKDTPLEQRQAAIIKEEAQLGQRQTKLREQDTQLQQQQIKLNAQTHGSTNQEGSSTTAEPPQDTQTQTNELQSQRDSLKRQIDALQSQRDALTREHNEIQEQRDGITRQLAEVTDPLASIQGQLAEIQKQRRGIATRRGEIQKQRVAIWNDPTWRERERIQDQHQVIVAQCEKQERKAAEFKALEDQLATSKSPYTRNSYYIRKIAEADALGQLDHVETYVHALQRVNIDPGDNALVKARKEYENARVDHIVAAAGKAKEDENPNELRMALYEERYHASIVRYNTNRAKYALENKVSWTEKNDEGKEIIKDEPINRLKAVRKMHLEDIITDPSKLTDEQEAAQQKSQRNYDETMYRVKPPEFVPGKTGIKSAADNAADFTVYARERARYEVQKLIDKTADVNDKAKMIDNRGDLEKDFVDRFTKTYGEERTRAHEFERVKMARKTMNDFARKQLWLSLLMNTQMAYNSFDQSVDSTMNSIIRSSTRTA